MKKCLLCHINDADNSIQTCRPCFENSFGKIFASTEQEMDQLWKETLERNSLAISDQNR